MPDTIRATSGGLRAQPSRNGFGAAALLWTSVLLTPAHAAPETVLDRYAAAFASLDRQEIIGLVLTLSLLCFAVVTAILLVRTRLRAAQAEWDFRDEIIALRAEADRANTLLLSEPQIIVAWAAAANEPNMIGDTSIVTDASAPHRVLAFGTWLEPDKAKAMEDAVEALRAEGQSFAMTVTTRSGRPIEAEGRAIGGRAVLRLRDVSGIRRALAELEERHHRLAADVGSLHGLVGSMPFPVWARDRDGKLAFVNRAYAAAVEAADANDAVTRGLELLDRGARLEVQRMRMSDEPFSGRFPVVVAGKRRVFDVLVSPTPRGSAGIGIDTTDVDKMRSEIARMNEAHRRLLDQLATGVAIFGADQKLAFYNSAYRALWDLDAGFLDQTPSDGAVLDKLRAMRKLPYEQDFRQWKSALHEAYRAVEAKEHMWHLPDGRTLRVVTAPNPEGGVTYLFEDVTERLDLVRRFDALIRVQRETLDHLAEAVAVFGSDGRLRLYNPVFMRMWLLEADALAAQPHIETVTQWFEPLYGDRATWQTLRGVVTAIDSREPIAQRLERRDGSVIDCATVPLPDGATLVTFLDVTDTVNVERALREKAEALELADELKVDFVHHVSYELRSPLTNIIGFAHFLGDPTTGVLNAKQHEYLGYITTSTNALLALINNILDLATIDAGAMTLNLGAVDIRKTMEAAVEGVQDRLVKDGITLKLDAAADIGSFTADERRVRQILFNLLSNAVGFSPAGETVTLAAERFAEAVVFRVTDRGPGIPAEMTDRVFDWFETHSQGSTHRGTGLGLSLVRSFVELHGGTVRIESAVGRGTTVICSFPVEQAVARTAA
jgi:signal transduction histidine kinase